MSDRGKDVSDELTEVRTVLSRAETALARLGYYERRRGEPRILRWEVSAGTGKLGPVMGEYGTDPDIGQMKLALANAVLGLEQWRKAGTTASQRRRRWIEEE